MRAVPVLCLVVLALAACDRRDRAEAPEAPAAASSAPAAAAPAPTRPVRAPGLWETSASLEGADTVFTSRLCLDERTDEKLSLAAAQPGAGDCRTTQTRQPDGSWRFSSVCDMGSGGRTTTTGTATGDFASRYTVQAETRTEGAAAPQLNRTARMTLQAVRQGACPADMRPGDVAIAGLGTINVAD
jgi:hypothetical protein